MKSLIILSVCVLVFQNVSAKSLPPYLKACKKTDPNLNKCVAEDALAAFSKLADGDKDFNIPPMDPLRFPLIEFIGNNFKLRVKDAVLTGLKTLTVNSMSIDPVKRRFESSTHMNRAVLIGTYEVEGKISVLPIKGTGKARLEFLDGDYFYNFNWDVKNIDGVDYAEIVKQEGDYKLGKLKFQLDNLFGGDEKLGKRMNEVLNEQWQVVSDELKGSISKAVVAVCSKVTKAFFKQIPYNQLFI